MPITSGVTITYEAVADARGSINTISSTKTNFWSYIYVLFHNNNAPDIGLTGNHTQQAYPNTHKLRYDSKNAYWTADGIPTVPYDDQGNRDAYSMAKIVARDSNGNVLASAKIVLAVSDEMSCSQCHASNSDPYAKPNSGWENNSNPAVDVKLNILHKSGTPILCAACHSTNALGAKGLPGIEPETTAMHKLHGPQINLTKGVSLDNQTSDLKSCYLCHPGVQTKCLRGAMNKQQCMDCHGNLTLVGNPNRQGWLDLPACQMCHNNSTRYTNAFSSPGHWRTTSDTTFATNPNKPLPGKSLYRFSSRHGAIYCSACHGSPHAEYPTLQTNDNMYSQSLQGHTGKIAECSVCHTSVPNTANGGPHNGHNVGQNWVDSHHDYVEQVGLQACAYCHGSDFRGSFLSQTSMARTFTTEEYGPKTYKVGDKVTCYDCHNGPDGG